MTDILKSKTSNGVKSSLTVPVLYTFWIFFLPVRISQKVLRTCPRHFLTTLLLLLVPALASAADTIITFTDRLTGFLGNIFINFLLAVALITFLWNAARYFVIGSGNEQQQERAKMLALYGIMAFVLISIMWGIINFLVVGLGFNQNGALDPDFRTGYNADPSVDS